MSTLVVLVLLAVAGWLIWKLYKKPDQNNDGVVDHKDVVEAAKEVVEETRAEVTAATEAVVEKAKKVRKPRVKKKVD